MKIRFLFSASAFIAFIIAAVCVTAEAQHHERLIKRMPIEKNEPLVITEIKVNGRSVQVDKEFLADDDWMKSLVISVKNTTDKYILFANLDLIFVRPPGSETPIAGFEMFYGNYLLRSRPPTEVERSTGLAPQGVADFQLNANEFQGLQRLLKDAGLPLGVEKLNLKLGEIIFADDTMWYVGTQFRRGTDLTSWIRVRPRKSERH